MIPEEFINSKNNTQFSSRSYKFNYETVVKWLEEYYQLKKGGEMKENEICKLLVESLKSSVKALQEFQKILILIADRLKPINEISNLSIFELNTQKKSLISMLNNDKMTVPTKEIILDEIKLINEIIRIKKGKD